MNQRANILFVDDEKKFADAMAKVLRYGGYSVQTAYAGSEALEKYQTEKFDLVITDLKMPVMDGIELIRHIRGIKEDQKILVVTAFPGQCMPWNRRFTESGGEEFDMGKIEYLVKPFSPKMLIEAVEKIFRNERISDDTHTSVPERNNEVLDNGIEKSDDDRKKSEESVVGDSETATKDFIPTAARQILEETSQALGAASACALVERDGKPLAVVNDSGAAQDAYSGKFSTVITDLRDTLAETGSGNLAEGILKLDNQWILVHFFSSGNCYLCIITGLEVPMGTLRTVAKKTIEGLSSLLDL